MYVALEESGHNINKNNIRSTYSFSCTLYIRLDQNFTILVPCFWISSTSIRPLYSDSLIQLLQIIPPLLLSLDDTTLLTRAQTEIKLKQLIIREDKLQSIPLYLLPVLFSSFHIQRTPKSILYILYNISA